MRRGAGPEAGQHAYLSFVEVRGKCYRTHVKDYENSGSSAYFVLALTSNQGEHVHI